MKTIEISKLATVSGAGVYSDTMYRRKTRWGSRSGPGFSFIQTPLTELRLNEWAAKQAAEKEAE